MKVYTTVKYSMPKNTTTMSYFGTHMVKRSSQCSMTGVTKAVVCDILTVGFSM